MPKSKRAKVVHLSKTDKKGKELSQKLFANVQEAAEAYQHIFVFSVENMRNSYLKEVRQEFSDCRCAITTSGVCHPTQCNTDIPPTASFSARPKSWPKPSAKPPQRSISQISLS